MSNRLWLNGLMVLLLIQQFNNPSIQQSLNVTSAQH
jgi:hypothetical protein